jgi:D-alanyl-D-alanine carboxypeptidase (penicillin-binding protein 5/6)
MKNKSNMIYNSWRWALLLCMLIACSISSNAAIIPESPEPSIYSAALDKPQYPKDTVDAQLKALSADGWFMIDAKTGLVLSTKNPDKRLYPASMTKILTGILACESGRLTETVTISAKAAAVPYAKVRRGEKYVFRDLLYRAMITSDNGAAHAIGEFLAGDSLSFAEMMNNKAKAIGMRHSHFVNAHGLPDDNHYTTPRDMMKLVKYSMKNKDFAQIVATPACDITTTAGKVIHLKNTNRLFGTYEGCIGIKTGTTRAAGGCLASAVERNGTRIYLVIMKCQPSRARTQESIVLYDKGFEMIEQFKQERRNRQQHRNNVQRPRGNQRQEMPYRR